jgi:hypothetical protein
MTIGAWVRKNDSRTVLELERTMGERCLSQQEQFDNSFKSEIETDKTIKKTQLQKKDPGS